MRREERDRRDDGRRDHQEHREPVDEHLAPRVAQLLPAQRAPPLLPEALPAVQLRHADAAEHLGNLGDAPVRHGHAPRADGEHLPLERLAEGHDAGEAGDADGDGRGAAHKVDEEAGHDDDLQRRGPDEVHVERRLEELRRVDAHERRDLAAARARPHGARHGGAVDLGDGERAEPHAAARRQVELALLREHGDGDEREDHGDDAQAPGPRRRGVLGGHGDDERAEHERLEDLARGHDELPEPRGDDEAPAARAHAVLERRGRGPQAVDGLGGGDAREVRGVERRLRAADEERRHVAKGELREPRRARLGPGRVVVILRELERRLVLAHRC